MRRLSGVLVVLCLAMAPTGTRAEQALPDAENGRFTFSQVAGGVLRLDTRSGAVSACRPKSGSWACEAVADDRAAFESEIARLQAENGALRRELTGRGAKPPHAQDFKLPSEADLDRAMTFLEKVWRRLIEMVQRVQKDIDPKS